MTTGPFAGMDIDWLPLLPPLWLYVLAVLALAALAVALWRRAYGLLVRVLLCAVLAVLLLQPSVRQDQRQSLPDKVLVVVDDSVSQKIGKRDEAAAAALAHIEEQIATYGSDVQAVVVRAPQYSDPRKGEATHVFSLLREQMLSLPLAQLAGTIIITDGQVHDAPESAAELGALARLAPIHVVLTGKRDEYDRKVSVMSAPQYGLINQSVDVTVKVEEKGPAATQGAPVELSVWQDGEQQESRMVMAGAEAQFTLPLAHPGQNVFEFRTPVVDGEMTESNNIAPVIVNAVRDRLKVLLVSGVPHMGERAWRNLLKSDPGIDLIHFTILRPPTSMDVTPPHELSLIVFPVDELFNSRINDFDLIIFDKYRQFNLLPPAYFDNIRTFIRNGGAFLLAMGSDEIEASVLQSPLGDTLPVQISGANVLTGAYRPTLSELGKRHPVTADLTGSARWGQWLTQTPIAATRGKTLMTGQNQAPLLVIDEVDKGRAAVIASDNLWMWAKGGQAAGPYNDLLRNLSHWLMREPELEEDYLKASVTGRTLTVAQRPGDGTAVPEVEITLPSGERQPLSLSEARDGWLQGSVTAAENGIYVASNGKRKAFVVVGTAQSLEYSDVMTTPERLKTAVKQTNAGIVWYQERPDFELRRVDKTARTLAGDSWLGLRRSEAYSVTSVSARNIFDNPAFLALALLALVGVWAFESGRLSRKS